MTNESIGKIIHPGKWLAEFDEYGRQSRVVYDLSYLKLLGFKDETEYKNTNKSWDNSIHPEDMERLETHTREVMAKHPEGMDFDIEYRMKTKQGYRWFHDFAYCRRSEDGTLLRCDGVIFDIQDSVDAEKSKRNIISKATDVESLYLVNSETGHFQILKQNDYLAERYSFDEIFMENIALYIKSDVFAPDQKMAEAKISRPAILRALKKQSEYNVRYRDISSGVPRWYEMHATKLSDKEFLCSFTDKDDEIIYSTLDSMVRDDNFAIFYIDLDSEQLKVMRSSPWDDAYQQGDVLPYRDVLSRLSSIQKEKATEKFYGSLSDAEFIKTAFAVENKQTHSYCSVFIEGNKWINVTVYVIARHDDGTPSTLAICFNILDTLGSARLDMEAKLSDALKNAKQANKAKTTFLFNMSHDIRTPMNAIIGFTSMAQKNLGNNARTADYLNKIDVSGKQLLSLVNQVLEMARIDSGKIEFDNQPVDVHEKHHALITILSEQAKLNGIRFYADLKNVTHHHVLADDTRLGQIALNIAGNALKYTPTGGKVHYLLQELPCEKEGKARYQLSISDTGIGMSKEYLKILFEPFTREKTSTVSKIQGTGLGLSIVKNLVDLLGGSIRVQSTPGKGSIFDVILDLDIAEKAAPEADLLTPLDDCTAFFQKKRVLLTEDNELNREIASELLIDDGMIVEEAVDGTCAVKLLEEKGPHYYDFILMDIQMPEMDGYTATKEIRKMYPKENIPIIALSANAFAEDKAASIAAGMNDHVAKPIDIKELEEALLKCL